MSTMYRLILTAFTLLNLSPTSFAASIVDTAVLGPHPFDPYMMPSHIGVPATSTVGRTDWHPGTFPRRRGEKTLIVLDNDGVLINGEHDFPRAAALLAALARNPENEVWVNTARGLDSLPYYTNIPGLNIAAEHGTILHLSQPDGTKITHRAVHHSAGDVRNAMQQVARDYQRGMKVFPAQNVAAYRFDGRYYDSIHLSLENEIRTMLARQFPEFMLRLEPRRAYGEVKHIQSDKGNLVAYLLATGRYRRAIAMGDQNADEGMFQAMNYMGNPTRFQSVIVSEKSDQETSAKYKLQDVNAVHSLLAYLM